MKLFKNHVIMWVFISIALWLILTSTIHVAGSRVHGSSKDAVLKGYGPVPHSAPSPCTRIGGGNGGTRVHGSSKDDVLKGYGPVPPSAPSPCTRIGGGNGGDHRPCPPSTHE